MLRKCICMIVTVALVVCVSVAPVGAVDAEGSWSFRGFSSNPSLFNQFTFFVPRYGNKDAVFVSDFPVAVSPDYTFFGILDGSYSLPEELISGSVGVYWSFALSTNFPSYIGTDYVKFFLDYSLGNTSSFFVPFEVSISNFSVGVSDLYPSDCVNLSARIDDVDALTSLSLRRGSLDGSNSTGFVVIADSSYSVVPQTRFYIPSFSVVHTESSADLDALESVADQIAEGNDIARAMYGDIMAALNALKDDTALMASYINDCLTYLNSIETATIGTYNLVASYLHNLASIAQTAEDIEAELESFHTDFMSKLALLISTITSESDDIQATMDRIYEQLIAWLETNFKEAISPEFEGSNSDLSQGIANNDAIEQEWTGSLSDTWSAMHIADFTFDSSFTSGFMWVSGWFSNIYNSLGLYGSIVILPLIIGICKLLLGYFRFAGHGHSKGGGDVDA